MNKTYKTEGFILKRSNFGEADRLLTIFTKHQGKIRVRAPGIRKTQSRKGAHLELFNLAGLFLAQGKSLDIVTEAETLNNFSPIRKDLKKVWTAYYFCELADSLCAERQENEEVFELLKKSLENLSNSCHAEFIRRKASLISASVCHSREGGNPEILKQVQNDDNMYYHSEFFANNLLQILGYLPRDRSLNGDSLERFIENILERQIRTKKLLRKI